MSEGRYLGLVNAENKLEKLMISVFNVKTGEQRRVPHPIAQALVKSGPWMKGQPAKIEAVIARMSKKIEEEASDEKKIHRVVASYPITERMDFEWDTFIRFAGGEDASSGSGFGDGERDLEFEFETQKEAKAAIKRIRALNIDGLKVRLD